MEKNETLCPLSETSFHFYRRLSRLSILEEMLASTYEYFFSRVVQPYSHEEQEILMRIIDSLSALIQGETPAPCSFCRFTERELAFWRQPEFFRLILPESEPFGLYARLYCLQELEKRLICFFVSETGRGPCSYREAKVLRRIKKLFVHELRDTPMYDLFKATRARRLSAEKQQELKLQKKDEARLKHVSIYRYNPLSQKYKQIKEEYLRKGGDEVGEL